MSHTVKDQVFEMGDHAAVFYESDEAAVKLLADYFGDGLKRGELCVYVSSKPADQLIDEFAAAGLDVTKAVKRGDMRLFSMSTTYLPDGHFVADFMLKNVTNFIDDATESGYKGLRTAGEMSWLYEQPEFYREAAQYEGAVNDLGAQHPHFTGLCLYPAHHRLTQIIDDVVKTHPVLFYDGSVRQNPDYAIA